MARKSVTLVAACVGAIAAARVASRFYWDPGLAALAGSWVPPDLGVFLRAGSAILHGNDLYLDAKTVGTEFGYVYPPLLAWAISPLSLLPGSGAAALWTLLLVLSLLAGLRLLGVVDIRCYLAAIACPFTRAAFEYGAIGPLLLLLIALAWRARDRPWAVALASGAAMASKLFLWPLAVWLFATRRSRAGAFAVLAAMAFVFVPWAAIGFSGLVQYPHLLDKAGARQGYRSYSLEALLQSLGASRAVAMVAAWAVGVALLVLAYRAARSGGAAAHDRDRRSLNLVIVASLVLTPIVWSHYLVLVLIPVALAYPTFSAVWLAVAASAVLDAFHWYRASPDGNLLPVAVVVALVTAMTLVAMRSSQSPDRVRDAVGEREPLEDDAASTGVC